MKIESIGDLKSFEEKDGFKDNIFSILFSICKTDPMFKNKNKIEKLKESIEFLNKKTIKYNSLLNQSKKIENDIKLKLNVITSDIDETVENLLNKLGKEV
jgi:hypothetical protein